ncbi:MAG: methyltransferase family protein [Promethearchaeota archaeon]
MSGLNFIKIYLMIVIIVHLISFIAPLIVIKKKGNDPHGIHKGNSILARLTPVSYFLLIIFIMLYLFFDTIIEVFWTFQWLAIDSITIIGIIMVAIGSFIEIVATRRLGINFRIELPKEQTELVVNGIYRLMRNPIAFSLYLFVLGIFLMIPNVISLIIFIMIIMTFNAKVRNEENFLSERFGKDYEAYKMKVGRYFPIKFKKRK